MSAPGRALMAIAQGGLHGLSLYYRLTRAQIRSQFQYRASFALQAVGQFLGAFTGFISVLLLFHRFPTLAGWSLGEVAFLYGLGGIAFGLSDLLAAGFEKFHLMVQTGTFDRVLTRPVSTFVQILGSDFELRRVSRIVQAAVALVLALAWLEVEWNVAKVLVAVSAVLSGMVIFCAIWVIGAAVTFWTIERSEMTNVFTYGGELLVSYPMPIYADWLRRVFTFVVPLAFVSYLPAVYIFERPDPLGLPPILQLCSPLVAAAFILIARGVWEIGVRHYQSTGS
jgi:ABC-2 type transport system permease protein